MTSVGTIVCVGAFALSQAALAQGGRTAGVGGTQGRPEVGVLMRKGQDAHSCTASVIRSRTHDLILTAAHCIAGDPTRLTFVPRLNGSSQPYGQWDVTQAYVDPSWRDNQNQDDDFAILRVKGHAESGTTKNVQDVTGGFTLATSPVPKQTIQVVGYNSDGESPISCDAHAVGADEFKAFHCDGFAAGSSGSPWITKSAKPGGSDAVSGVIGGRNLGGCSTTSSFSAPFDRDVFALLQRAEKGDPGDSPSPADDGCGGD